MAIHRLLLSLSAAALLFMQGRGDDELLLRQVISQMSSLISAVRNLSLTVHRLESKLDHLGQKLDQLGQRFDRLGQRFDNLGQRFDNMGQRFDHLGQRFDHLGQRFDNMGQRFDNMGQRFDHLGQRFEQLGDKVEVGFSSFHDFGRNRYSVTGKASNVFNGYSTDHAVYLHGKVAVLTFAHHNNSSGDKVSFVEGRAHLKPGIRIITHPTHDLALHASCPQTALNINNYTIPEIGDRVVGIGASWMGMIADVEGGFVNSSTFPHWLGTDPNKNGVFSYDYVISGTIISLQRGGPVANGCGYFGMAHAVNIVGNANIAVVTSAKRIVEFLYSNFDVLKSADMCNTEIVELPIMPFIKCNVEQSPRPLPSQIVV